MTGQTEPRWRAYLSATVVAVIDDAFVDLTGPSATGEWPFVGEVFALTAWDPFGHVFDRATNDSNNSLLHEALVDAGATVYRSAGFDAAGFDAAGFDAAHTQKSEPPAEPIAANRFESGSPAADSERVDWPEKFGTFIDEGFVVVGISESEVMNLARRFDQEAIYRMEPDTLTVVSAADSYSESRPRV